MNKLRMRLLLLFIGFFSLGCGTPSTSPGPTKQQTRLLLGVVIQEEDTTHIKSVIVTLTGSDLSEPIELLLAKEGDQWLGAFESSLLAGKKRTVHAVAKDESGNVVYQGHLESFTLHQNASRTILLSLQPDVGTNGALPFINTAPHISSLSASSYEVRAGQTIQLSSVAGDVDVDSSLTYRWAGPGEFTQSSTLSTEWTAPVKGGLYEVRFTVKDQDGAESTLALVLDVKDGSSSGLGTQKIEMGKARVRARFNNWPVVNRMWVKVGNLQPGQTTKIFSKVVDPDFGPRSFQWSDNCGGSFLNATKRNTKWTAPSTAPTNRRCILSLKATDRKNGIGQGSLTVLVGHQAQLNLSPQIQSTFQTEAIVQRGKTAVLRVTAVDPEGTLLRFRWFAFWGRLDPPVNTSTTSQVTWKAPNRRGTHYLFVLITDATGARSFERFVIRVP